MFVKVCGIKEKFEVELLVSLPVSHFGFIIGVEALSEDEIDTPRAKVLIEYLRSFKKKFPIPTLVTHLREYRKIERLVLDLGVSFLQLQNEVSLDLIERLRLRFPWLKIIKAIHVLSYKNEVIEKVRYYENHVDYILLDSRDSFRMGGTGMTHDWNISSHVVRIAKKPVILAGGLNSSNVLDAVLKVCPFGVDANSRLKDDRGYKDPRKVREFVINYFRALAARRQVC
ncbi:MAG: phosphoribosylanthranilate isomerase [Thermosulfidibacteraceae bacterium]|jgi:phosphoribosylanthranilate isomerase